MALNIGIDYKLKNWRTCLVGEKQGREFSTFPDVQAIFSYIKRIDMEHSELVIALAGPQEAPLISLERVVWETRETGDELTAVRDILHEVNALNLKGYLLPSIKYLSSVPSYRRLKYTSLGNADKLCAVATLLYRMRQQEALWSEIHLLYLEVSLISYSITAIKDGYVVDGIEAAFSEDEDVVDEEERELAFRERLVQDLAGLMAIHHLEDIVIGDRNAAARKEDVIESLGESYQFYQFPLSESEPQGFEAAMGAAILAEGLSTSSGLAMEVTGRLLSVLAHA